MRVLKHDIPLSSSAYPTLQVFSRHCGVTSSIGAAEGKGPGHITTNEFPQSMGKSCWLVNVVAIPPDTSYMNEVARGRRYWIVTLTDVEIVVVPEVPVTVKVAGPFGVPV